VKRMIKKGIVCSICGKTKNWLCWLPVRGRFLICGDCSTLIQAGYDADKKYLEKNITAAILREMKPLKEEVVVSEENTAGVDGQGNL